MTKEQKRKLVAEEIWLDYFNRYLYERKTITHEEYLQMTRKITEHIGKKRKRLLSNAQKQNKEKVCHTDINDVATE